MFCRHTLLSLFPLSWLQFLVQRQEFSQITAGRHPVAAQHLQYRNWI